MRVCVVGGWRAGCVLAAVVGAMVLAGARGDQAEVPSKPTKPTGMGEAYDLEDGCTVYQG